MKNQTTSNHRSYPQNHYKAATALLAALAASATTFAQPVWTGATDNVINTTTNWSPALSITSGTTTNSTGAVFSSAGSGGTSLTLSADLQFAGGTATTSNAMLFDGAGFTIVGSGSATRQLTIGGQGLAINTTNTITLDVPRVRRNASNTFEFLGSSGNLVINSEFSTNVTGASDTVTRVDFTGTGGNNNTITFNGNVVKVFTPTSPGAGAGTFTISSVGTGNRVVFNNASNSGFTGAISVGNNAQLQLGNGGANGTLAGSGAISLGNSASRLIIDQSDTVTQGTEFTSSISGAGLLVQQGAGTTILNAANGFSGGVTVSAGTLLVENTTGSGTGSGAVSVSSGAALGGDGTISGAVTFASGAKFVFSVSSTLDVAGTTTLPTTFGIDDLLGISNSVASSAYTLIGGSGSVSYTTLENLGLSNAYDLGLGKSAYFDLTGDNLSVVVTASAVPEPSSFAALAGLGILGFAAVRRRRHA